MSFLIDAVRGFFMALADSVPGVSGGTVAFILGFYDKFVGALDGVFYGNKEEKKASILFLLKLGCGWAVGMILAILLLANLFESKIYAVSSVFLGFILFSIPLIIKEEKESFKGKYSNLIFTVVGISLVSLITFFNPIASTQNVVDISSLTPGLIIYVFIAAIVAISAMVLPGISGSTLLLIFGLYMPIISSVKEILHMNFNYLPIVIIFGLGIIVGIALIIRILKIALEKYRSQTMYLVLGLMIGSVYPIIMGPTTLDIPQSAMSFETFSILWFILGGALIIALDRIKVFISKKQNKENSES